MNVTNVASSYIVRTDSIKSFLSDIIKVKILSPKEEIEIFQEIEKSKNKVYNIENDNNLSYNKKITLIKKEEDYQALLRNKVIMANMRFIFAVAKRYDNNEILLDLVNVGTIGMWESLEKFDYTKNIRFYTFASWFIRRAINAYLQRENISIKTTKSTLILPKVKNIENKFILENGRAPIASEVMEILNDEHDVKVDYELDVFAARVESIDDYIGDNDDDYCLGKTELFNSNTASYNDFEQVEDKEYCVDIIKRAFKTLTEKEQIIISMVNGYGYEQCFSYSDIADLLGFKSKERVRQLHKQAEMKLAKFGNKIKHNQSLSLAHR